MSFRNFVDEGPRYEFKGRAQDFRIGSQGVDDSGPVNEAANFVGSDVDGSQDLCDTR
jgi:hypothetical protein